MLPAHYMKGALFENLVITEIMKSRLNANLEPNLYFWRDKTGHEIDCLIETATKLIPIEIKAGQTVASGFFKNMQYWHKLVGPAPAPGYIVYAGDQKQIRQGIEIISFRDLTQLFHK